MTNQQHPITPTPELVEAWWLNTDGRNGTSVTVQLCIQAAQWGADQELEACCDHIHNSLNGKHRAEWLHDIRRPKPPSLKEQALALINKGTDLEGIYLNVEAHKCIRQALEALPNDWTRELLQVDRILSTYWLQNMWCNYNFCSIWIPIQYCWTRHRSTCWWCIKSTKEVTNTTQVLGLHLIHDQT